MKSEDKATNQQWNYLKWASILLIAGIAACAGTANLWPDKVVITMGAIIGVVVIVLFVLFFKRTGWFSSRHSDGGSSVK
jgi:polyferredoxin